MRSVVAVAFLTLSGLAFGGPQEDFFVPKMGSYEKVGVFRGLTLDDTYRIGDEWGKKPVTDEDLANSENLRMIAQATGRLGGATAFYIGEFGGYNVLATNHHVCPNTCKDKQVRFPLLGISAKVTKFFGTWTDIDFALMAIELTPEQKAKLDQVARPVQFDAEIYPGQELITVGFGVGANPQQKIVANQDSDCKVFSEKNDFRFMADPDQLNPGPYKAWSFSHACDVSHGDSGSAMVDRATGNVVGIVWTGKIPKSEKVQSSDYLNSLMGSGSEDIWTELSYAVPAKKMAEFLGQLTNGDSLDAEVKTAIQDMLQ